MVVRVAPSFGQVAVWYFLSPGWEYTFTWFGSTVTTRPGSLGQSWAVSPRRVASDRFITLTFEPVRATNGQPG